VITWIRSLFVSPSKGARDMPPSLPNTSSMKVSITPTAPSRRRAPSCRDEPSHAVVAPRGSRRASAAAASAQTAVKEEPIDDDEDSSSLYMLNPGPAAEEDSEEMDQMTQESEGSSCDEAEDEEPCTSATMLARMNRNGRKRERKPLNFKREASVESNDSESTTASSPKKRSHYMVSDVFSGKPAERFRTDILTRIRTGDEFIPVSDPGVPSSSLRLTDRWREEWSHGVQVPLNPHTLPQFETQPCDIPYHARGPFRLPRGKYLLSQSAPYEREETHVVHAPPPLRIYQGDRLDELWMERINREHAANFLPMLDMMTLLTLMNEFEIECFQNIHRVVLTSLASPSSSLNTADMVDEDAPCDVCQIKDDDDDPMIFCDGCNICLHLSCYDLTEIPAGHWECDMCKAVGFTRHDRLRCQLCPNQGGAMKELEEGGKWVHVSCAMWIPEVRFIRKNGREVIGSLDTVLDQRWQLKCSICDLRTGACIQCAFKACATAFHTTCAQRSRVCDVVHETVESSSKLLSDQKNEINDSVNFHAFCKRHTAVMKRMREGETGVTDAVDQSDDESDERSEVLRALERAFFLHVKFEDVAKRLGVPMLHASDVYEYWKQKRAENGGRPLIDSPQIEIEVDTETPILTLASVDDRGDDHVMLRASDDVQHQLTPFQLKCWRFQKHVFQTLDRGRLGCDMIMKRERKKKEVLETNREVFTRLGELDSCPSGVPLSTRALGQMIEYIHADMTPEEIAESEREAITMASTSSAVKKEKTTVGGGGSGVKRRADTPASPAPVIAAVPPSSRHSLGASTSKENGGLNTSGITVTPTKHKKNGRRTVSFNLPASPPHSPSRASTSSSPPATTTMTSAAKSRRLMRPQNPPDDLPPTPTTSSSSPSPSPSAPQTPTKLRERREVKYF
ncbi:hypothetical protein PFISCL1PPCAC_12418, partial [Pristionchus fissidentatus]